MTIRTAVAVLAVLGVVSAQGPAPLSEDEKILHALSRLSFGPKPGQLEQVKQLGLAKWIDRQLDPATAENEKTTSKLAAYETLGLSPGEQKAFFEKLAAAATGKKPERDPFRRRVHREMMSAIVVRALESERETFEVLADFWRNHFNVDTGKDSVLWTATHYEEKILRPNVFGKFSDMLEGTARHPAMLVYLDNALSRRPPPKSELRQIERRVRKETGSRESAKEQVEIAKQSGLNENYARELMELHTLGVDNGYTQKDVTEVARAFTGWSIDFEAEGTGFSYKDAMHDPGPKTVLGRPLPEGKRDEGIVEGEAVLKRLAAHDNTATFVSTKLVRYLVDDLPPPAIVDAAAKAFKRTKGDLREVVRAIVQHPEFFDRSHYRAKFKTPLEFVLSALRATDAAVTDPWVVADQVFSLGLRVYNMEDPTGYSDTAEAWRDPGVMALRWRFAMNLAEGRLTGILVPPSFYEGLPADPLEMTAALTRKIVPSGLAKETAAVIERVVFQDVAAGKAADDAGRRKLARRLAGILLGSPEFQQQ